MVAYMSSQQMLGEQKEMLTCEMLIELLFLLLLGQIWHIIFGKVFCIFIQMYVKKG